VSNVVEEIHGINNFQIFFDKLYSPYHRSPKNPRELDEIVSSIGICLLNTGRILGPVIIPVKSPSTNVLKGKLTNHNFFQNICLMGEVSD
jgi:hypothetical protein